MESDTTQHNLTSFVGDALGPAVGGDDGCSDVNRKLCEQVFKVSSKGQEMISVHSIHHNKSLTCFDGDPVGTSVGLEEGETDGPLLGLCEGDKLGLDVGCEMRMMRTK